MICVRRKSQPAGHGPECPSPDLLEDVPAVGPMPVDLDDGFVLESVEQPAHRLEGGLMRGKPTPESSRTCRDSGAARATDGWRCVVCGRLVIDGLFRWWGGSGQDRRGVARKDRLLLLPRPRNQQALVRGRRGQSGRRPSPARSCSCKGSAGAERRKNRADYGTGHRRGEGPPRRSPSTRRPSSRRPSSRHALVISHLSGGS